MKKKLLFTAESLEVGGIEKALINLLNRIDSKTYEVTLILRRKEGVFLNMVPDWVEVLEYHVSDHPNILWRKIKNRFNLMKWKRQLHHQYDFSCSFATYFIAGAHLALSASNQSTLWMHGNYYVTYKEKMKDFLDGVMAKSFAHIVFVSEENKRDVTGHYAGIEEKSIVCNNLIDGDTILKKMEEPCLDFQKRRVTFVNVGRHDEYQKRLSRIIHSSAKLKEEGFSFDVLLIGDGPDTLLYQEMVEEYHLSDTIHFLGRKANPYPYFKLGDATLLSSEYEGYPVVFLESMVVNRPIISTMVSDYESLDGLYGIFQPCTEDGVYDAMRTYLEQGFEIKVPFEYQKFNLENFEKLIALFEGNV